MKAIPTTFMGTKYRSRLEARWAEFLTSCGINFEYEPGHWKGEYNPDFWLPVFDLYVEVKPRELTGELDIFWDEILFGEPWICVDKSPESRNGWECIRRNASCFPDEIQLDHPCGLSFDVYQTIPRIIFNCPLIVMGFNDDET